MTTFKLTILTILIVFGLISCNPNYEKIFKENTEQFELNRINLNQVISNIQNAYIKYWDRQKPIVLNANNLNGQSKKTLKDLGIGSIEVTNNSNANCDNNYSITLNVIDNWNIETLRVVQLVYAPCDSNAIKNNHYYDGYHRDFWGQGGNWFIYSDTDFI